MSKKPHRWDDGIRDTRVRESRGDSLSGWNQSTHSTFTEPSRTGEPARRQVQAQRRLALRVAAGLGVAGVAGTVLMLLRGRQARD